MYGENYNEIVDKIKARLIENNFSFTPGSIVRLFTEIIAEPMSDFYDKLNEYFLNCFVSTSSGKYLDSIGMLVNCTRLEDERDEDYKYRICNQVNTLATSNELSILTAALSVENVEDVNIKNFSMGSGTFTIVVLGKNINQSTINEVYETVKKVKACGIKFNVIPVNKMNIKMNILLSLTPGLDELKVRDIKYLVKQKIKDYINGLKINEMFVTNKLTEIIMKSSTDILNYNVENFYINNDEINYINQECDWCSKFYVDKDINSINIL